MPLGPVGNMAEGVDRVSLVAMLQPLDTPSGNRKAASTGQLYCMVQP